MLCRLSRWNVERIEEDTYIEIKYVHVYIFNAAYCSHMAPCHVKLSHI